MPGLGTKPLVGLAYHRGKTFGIGRYVGPLVSPGMFALPLPALAAVDEVDSGWLVLLLLRLLVIVLDRFFLICFIFIIM